MNRYIASGQLALALIGLTIGWGAPFDQPQLNAQLTPFKRTIGQLKSLDQPLDDPRPGEWLSHHRELGQTFQQYVRVRPNVLTRQRGILYVQPLGKFSPDEQKIVDRTLGYLRTYFQCELKTLPGIDASAIPAEARRLHPEWGGEQWQTSFILEDLLAPRLPADAFATLALTNADLWPGEGWNFVFGYAAFRDRVGVWSLHRFGNPADNEEAFEQCLRRTIKLATHETGHMFSMQHCTAAKCNMQGSNNLRESDDQPLHLCSQCHAKLIWATGADPRLRFRALLERCDELGFADEAKFYRAAIDRLK